MLNVTQNFATPWCWPVELEMHGTLIHNIMQQSSKMKCLQVFFLCKKIQELTFFLCGLLYKPHEYSTEHLGLSGGRPEIGLVQEGSFQVGTR